MVARSSAVTTPEPGMVRASLLTTDGTALVLYFDATDADTLGATLRAFAKRSLGVDGLAAMRAERDALSATIDALSKPASACPLHGGPPQPRCPAMAAPGATACPGS